MLSSALSALIVLGGAANGVAPQAVEKDRAAWSRVVPSVASILRGNQDLGSAALVSSKGLFLTHLGAVYGDRIRARLSNGEIVEMTLKASDEPTQLAVLQASDWIKTAKPLAPVDGELKPGDRVLAVRSNAIMRAQFVTGTRYGVVAPSQRLMQLSEISFESPSNQVDGALVVTPDGRLVGFLNATLRANTENALSPTAPDAMAEFRSVQPMAKAVGGGGGGARKFGPGDMTVAYTTAPGVLQRAVDSLVRGKGIERPSIGVDVKNAEGGGALIDSVTPGSEADQAGLQAGDIVIEIDGVKISKQVDLAKAVMNQEIGSSLRMKVKRGRWTLTVPVKVGSKSQKAPLRPESAI